MHNDKIIRANKEYAQWLTEIASKQAKALGLDKPLSLACITKKQYEELMRLKAEKKISDKFPFS
jgi:hypothetical protein